MTFYWRSIVTTALSHVVSEILNVLKCCDLEIWVKGHSRSLNVVPFDRLYMVSYLCSSVTLSLRCTIFWLVSIHAVTFKPGLGLLKVIKNDTIWSGTHDFLLTFHSNQGPISYHFRDKQQFPLKIANFSHRVFNSPAEGVLFGIGCRCKGSKKIKLWGYQMVKPSKKSFKIV